MAKTARPSDSSRLATIQIQHEFVKRLRERHQDAKARAKHAKSNLDAALEDLEKLTGPNATGAEHPGELVIDIETDEIKNYKSIDDLEQDKADAAAAAREEKERLPFKSEELDTTSPLPNHDPEKDRTGKVLDGPKPRKKKTRKTGKDAAAGERDDDDGEDE